LEFWSVPNPWIFSLTIWVFLVSINAVHVKAYGELGGFCSYLHLPSFPTGVKTEYWLSSLKVVTIVVFILLGVLVNVGANYEHRFIGFENWHIPGAPFVGGFGGFAHVFVTASFACTLFLDLDLIIHRLISRRSWGDRESWNHCRRNEESG
jgi:AAT family amino acid transporter